MKAEAGEALMSQAPAAGPEKARFVTGSTMRHVLVMTSTTATGVITVFVVDLANLFYISLLGDTRLTAAVGYAATVFLFHFAFSVGLMIAGSALVARALGAGDRERARRVAASSALVMAAGIGVVSLATLPLAHPLLRLLGATGEAAVQAERFIAIVVPAMPLMGLGFVFSGILRATGDARRSMVSILVYGGVTAALDPILIFVLGLGVTGAAIVGAISRLAMAVYSWRAVVKTHDLLGAPTLQETFEDLRPLARIGIPAVLTNVATPVGTSYVTAAIAAHGDHAMAGWTIISRLVFVAFGALWALSGAVGPVLGQNFGAREFSRVRRALTDSLILTVAYVAVISVALFFARNSIAALFGAKEDDAALVVFFCTYLAATFAFTGSLFVANAAFNNLGYPMLSTAFNWGLATAGVIPLVWLGGRYAGAEGALAGYYLASIPTGIVAILVCYRVIGRLGATPPAEQPGVLAVSVPAARRAAA
jgi:putative MATE family efflux protein